MNSPNEFAERLARLERALDRLAEDRRLEGGDLRTQIGAVKAVAATLQEEFQKLSTAQRLLGDAQKKALAAAAAATSAADASAHRMQDIADGAIRYIDDSNKAREAEQALAREQADASEAKRTEAQKKHAERFERIEAGSVAQAKTLLALFDAVQASAGKSRLRTIYLGAFITLVTILTSQCNQALKTVYTAPPAHEVSK